jgi:hypothetical protein
MLGVEAADPAHDQAGSHVITAAAAAGERGQGGFGDFGISDTHRCSSSSKIVFG